MNNDLELNDGEVAEPPRMTTVTNLLEDFAKVDEDKKVTAGGNLREPAAEDGLDNHINPDAAATTKQDHAGGSGENGVMDQKTLSRREVLASCRKVNKPPGLLAPITIKCESLLQKLLKADRRGSSLSRNPWPLKQPPTSQNLEKLWRTVT